MHPSDWIFAERRHLFTQQDINSIDTDYFKIESKGSGCIVIQSKNIGHFWAISGAGYGNVVNLQHKHKKTDQWHPQAFHIGSRHTLTGAFEEIKHHDAYYLNKKRRKVNGIQRRQKT